MLKKDLSQVEALTLAEDLNLTSYLNLDKLVNSLQIAKNKNTKVIILTSDKATANHILNNFMGIKANISTDGMFKLEASYGTPCYSITTEYGEMSVEEELFTKNISSSISSISCAFATQDDSLKNIVLTFVYVPDYNVIGNDTWRYMLLESDFAIVISASHHILYNSEKEFINRHLLPIFSPTRICFGIGNAQNIKAAEWLDAIARVNLQLGREFNVFPIFTETVSDNRRMRFKGGETTLSTLLSGLQENLIKLRLLHIKDIETFKLGGLEECLKNLKTSLEELRVKGSESTYNAQKDMDILEQSKAHVQDNISLFLNSPLMSKYRTSIEEFSKKFILSLQEDIMSSNDIKKDSKVLPRYLAAIWNQVGQSINRELYLEFKNEASLILDMMQLDLRHLTRHIKNVEIKSNINARLENAFNVHTFFARKSSPGNGLTDALTIGGMIATLLFPLQGIAAIVGSELIKVFGKDAIDKSHKETLCKKISEVINGNKDELLRQADINFAKIAEEFSNEITAYYDEMIAYILNSISEENKMLAEAAVKIELINNYI